MAGNGFVIFLVCRKRQLRTKSNTFIVSLAVADFCYGMIAVPSEFLCDVMNECSSDKKTNMLITYIWVFILYASGTNLITLVLERYIAVVKPLKYLTFMTRHRVIQMVLISWGIPFLFNLIVLSMRLNSVHRISGYLHLFVEVILCAVLLFCHSSMLLVVYKQKSKDRTLAKQLRFNQLVANHKVKTQNSLAVKWVSLVTIVFLSCYVIIIRCSLLVLTGHPCNDFRYKGPLQAINSGINPLAYAFFKRDIKQECKRFLFKRRR